MKKCEYKRSDCWLYIQNRMSREEETEFQRHLLSCEECREDLAQLRLMVHSIGRKERRTISFRIWIVAASAACILMGGGTCYYFFTQKEDRFSPGNTHELKIHPPVRHDDRDSITSKDTIPADTLSLEVIMNE